MAFFELPTANVQLLGQSGNRANALRSSRASLFAVPNDALRSPRLGYIAQGIPAAESGAVKLHCF